MSNTTKVTFSTRKNRESAEVKTVLTIDWEGCTEEVLRAYATQALVVKLQGQFRKNGIPTETTARALAYAPGTRQARSPISKLNVETLKKLPAEELAELVKALKAAGAAV